jgi:hypothetical protein
VPCQRSYVAQGTGFSSGGGRISLKYRIASAESRLRVLSPGLRVVSILGGLTDGIADIATFGDEVVERSPDETIEDFQCRARALAIAAGSRSLVFGGLVLRRPPDCRKYTDFRGELSTRFSRRLGAGCRFQSDIPTP